MEGGPAFESPGEIRPAREGHVYRRTNFESIPKTKMTARRSGAHGVWALHCFGAANALQWPGDQGRVAEVPSMRAESAEP